jgi:hypothetical protein
MHSFRGQFDVQDRRFFPLQCLVQVSQNALHASTMAGSMSPLSGYRCSFRIVHRHGRFTLWTELVPSKNT